MPLFECIDRDDHWEIVLCRGRGNSLDREGLTQIGAFFGGRRGDGRGILMTHEGRSFCTGLDLDAVIEMDRRAMAEFMELFHRALSAVFGCPAPVVAAIGGHAMAGGALLALAADARLLATGPSRIGIHGVQMGIAYPDVAVELVRHQLERPHCERALFTGRLFSDREALAAGWVDRLVDRGDLVQAGRDRLVELGRSGTRAFAANKLRTRGIAISRLARFHRENADRWLDQWFSPATRAAIESSRNRAGARRGDRGS